MNEKQSKGSRMKSLREKG
jgi:hypothetical protein